MSDMIGKRDEPQPDIGLVAPHVDESKDIVAGASFTLARVPRIVLRADPFLAP